MHNDGRFYELADRKQAPLFAPSLWEAIAEDAEVLSLDAAVDKLDLSLLEAGYKRVGHPAYAPKVMLKLLLYGYAVGMRSSRQLDRACRRDDAFRYLAHGLKPDFRTICRFRREHEAALKELFRQTVRLCQEAGLVSLGQVAIDGTKLRANRSCEAQRELDKALQEAEAADADIPREEESRFMKLAGEGAVKPAYNAQLAVDSAQQVIVAQALVTAANDSGQLGAMVEQVRQNCASAPTRVSADGGYLSQENLEQAAKLTEVYMPVREAGIAGFEWVEQEGAFRCRRGELLQPRRRRRDNLVYRTDRCGGCPYATQCGIKGRSKELHVRVGSQALLELAQRMRTAAGQAIYAARKQIVEPVFGRFKHNWGCRRLLLQGKRGAGAEWSLLCIVHNLGKWAEKDSLLHLSAVKFRLFAQLLRRIASLCCRTEGFFLGLPIKPANWAFAVNL